MRLNQRDSVNDAKNVVFAENETLLAINLDFSSRIFSEDDSVALFDLEGENIAIILDSTCTDCDYGALYWLFFGALGKKEQAALCFCRLIAALDENSVMEWTNGHF